MVQEYHKTIETARMDTKQAKTDAFCALLKTIGLEAVKEYKFHPKRQWRADYAILSHNIIIEVEGGVWTQGRHTRGKGFIGDIEKYNAATSSGWRVLRFIPTLLFTQQTLETIKKTAEICEL